MQHYRARERINYMYSDGSGEIEAACKMDYINHDACAPGDKQANGIAERQVQEVKLATASNVAQAGLSHPYWSFAMRHAMMAWNITPKRDRGTPWELRFSERFLGMSIPFGARI